MPLDDILRHIENYFRTKIVLSPDHIMSPIQKNVTRTQIWAAPENEFHNK